MTRIGSHHAIIGDAAVMVAVVAAFLVFLGETVSSSATMWTGVGIAVISVGIKFIFRRPPKARSVEFIAPGFEFAGHSR